MQLFNIQTPERITICNINKPNELSAATVSKNTPSAEVFEPCDDSDDVLSYHFWWPGAPGITVVAMAVERLLRATFENFVELNAMDNLTNKDRFKCRFDFEIGYLVKSPCRECESRKVFPACIRNCTILDKIHTLLSQSVSSVNSL